jgi:hypothetical protein
MKEYRSLFLPMALLAAGVIWLLISMQVIPSSNLWALTRLLPYLLMALGAGLILRSYWAPAGMLVSALVVVGAALAVVYAPQLGWASAPAWDLDVDFGGRVPGSGRVETETREVSQFEALSIEYPAEVVIRQGGSESVTIQAEDNLLAQLTTRVSNGVLVIRNGEPEWRQRVDPSETVKITITVEDLRDVDFETAGSVTIDGLETETLTVSLDGAGEITLTDIQADFLECQLHGAGNIHADGAADEVRVEIDGFGSFYGEDLDSSIADVEINGTGSASLRVENQLTAEINGLGSVNYYGSPQVSQQVNGAGSVRQAGK